jgi:hypothetical protein
MRRVFHFQRKGEDVEAILQLTLWLGIATAVVALGGIAVWMWKGA